jgi:hypothetical protein
MGRFAGRGAYALAVLCLWFFVPRLAYAAAPPATFSDAAAQAQATLMNVFYDGNGSWRECNDVDCTATDSDWGADSATYSLYLRWMKAPQPSIRATMTELLDNGPAYGAPCASAPCPAWSDTPAWDAVAFMREGDAARDEVRALRRAQAAVNFVEQSAAFAGGACTGVPYQQAQPNTSHVKTLETDANLIKADLLIYGATQDRRYLNDALMRYGDDRTWFYDRDAALYTVHVMDDGSQCRQVADRFFASVNGDMIWNGVQLWHFTGQQHFYDEALATAQSVDRNLSDARGIFADLQGENDVVEPLVEAMYDLAAHEHAAFARDWIARNAGAALSARAPDGSFARLFDGPAQRRSSIWESNGGLALEIAAGALDPGGQVSPGDPWSDGQDVGATITTLPATIAFNGAGIALSGTIDKLCERGHVHVFIDGVETFDHTGLWQNYSMPGGDSVFFAWRWPSAGPHVVRLEPAADSLVGVQALHLNAQVLGQ